MGLGVGDGAEGAVAFAERVRRDVEALRIPNAGSRVCPTLTISLGVSTTRPKPAGASPALSAALWRLYGQFWSRGALDHRAKEVARIRNARVTNCSL